MSTPKTTFILTNGTALTDIYPLESNGVGNLSVPNEIIDIDSTAGGGTTITVFGDLAPRFVSFTSDAFAGVTGNNWIVCNDTATFAALLEQGLAVGMFVDGGYYRVGHGPFTPTYRAFTAGARVKITAIDVSTRVITLSAPLENNVTRTVAPSQWNPGANGNNIRFLTPFSIIDLDPLTPSPYIGEYGAESSVFNGGATVITINTTATPLVPATFDVVGVSIGTNGAWVIQGLTNARDVFYPTSTFTVTGNSYAPANTTYTVGSTAQSGSYTITDVVITATNTVLTVQGNVGQFFVVSSPLPQQLKIISNTSHDAGAHPLNGAHDIIGVGAYSVSTDSTTITIGTIVTGSSGFANGSVSPAIPTTAITVSGLLLNGAQADGVVKTGAPISAPLVAGPTVTPTSAHTYIVTWYVAGDKTAAFAPGASITIKNNNYYQLKRLTVDSSSYDNTNTSVRTIISDPSINTPVIGAAGSIVYPAIPVPYGYLQYAVLDIASPLQLVGRGVTHFNESTTWGQALQNNAIHQLENFANDTAPTSPLEGQFWFDTATPSLNIRSNGDWSGVVTAGMPVQGDIQMTDHIITGLGDLTGSDPTQAVNMQSGDDRYVNVTGDAMTGALDLGNNAITGVADINQALPQLSQALNVKSADIRYVHLSGDMMLGDLSMGGSHRIVNMANPADSQDAATKSYVDSLSAGIVWLQSVLESNLYDDSLSVPPVLADASLLYYRSYYVKPVVHAVTGVNDVTKTWRVAGDHTAVMATGDSFTIAGNSEPTANGTYTIASISTTAGDTLIVVNETIPSSATISGNLIHASGAWNGKDGHIMAWNGSSWSDVMDRPVSVGDRFGVFFEVDNDDNTNPVPAGSFAVGTALGTATASAAGKIVTVNAIGSDFAVNWGSTAGSTYPPQTPAEPDAVSVLGKNSPHYGHSYTFRGMWGTGAYNTDYKWIEFAGPAMLVDGSGLRYTGNILNVGQGFGIHVGATDVSLDTVYTDATYARRDGTTDFTGDVSMGGHNLIHVATPIAGTDAVNLQYLTDHYMATSGGSSMTGDMNMNGHLIFNLANPVSSTDAANMAYTDTKVAKVGDTMTGPLVMSSVGGTAVIDMGNNNRIISLADPINPKDALNLQTADGRYLKLDGGTMVGPLTLAATPTQPMHSATKQYVDDQAVAAIAAAAAAVVDGGSF